MTILHDIWIPVMNGFKNARVFNKDAMGRSTMRLPLRWEPRRPKIAIERAGITKEDVDFIIFATLSPDYFFPGCGVLMQREMGMTHIEAPALDIRNQCSGFVYGMSVADQFIKTGKYKNILLVGAEMHSMGLDYSTRGRNVTVIFGDGAGAVILQPPRKKEEVS